MDMKKKLDFCDVVKQGYLFIKRPPGTKWNRFKVWHERFFILRVYNSNIGAELVMYNSLQDAKDNNSSLNVFLRDAIHIGICSQSHRFSNTFVVVLSDRSPLLLASKNELTVRSWMLALDLTIQNKDIFQPHLPYQQLSSTSILDRYCQFKENSQNTESICSSSSTIVKQSLSDFLFSSEDKQTHTSNILLNFQVSVPIGLLKERLPVTLLNTEAAERLGVTGKQDLIIYTLGLGLAQIGESECSLEWPLAVIRNYKFESLHKICSKFKTSKQQRILVTIEVGRNSTSGEGIFKFTTDQGQLIMREFKKSMSTWIAYRQKERQKNKRKYRKRTGSGFFRKAFSQSESVESKLLNNLTQRFQSLQAYKMWDETSELDLFDKSYSTEIVFDDYLNMKAKPDYLIVLPDSTKEENLRYQRTTL